MNLYKTPITGMAELSGVGYYSSGQDAYNKVMTPAALKGISIVVASLTTDQTDAIKFLLKNGFTQVGPARRNPNTRNMILVFTKQIRSGDK